MIAERKSDGRDSPLVIKDRLANHRLVLEAIENILRLQKSRLFASEQLSRIEQIRHYDRSLMEKTYRDPRLFRRDSSGRLSLEKAYDEMPEESFDTYENRFALFVLSLIAKDSEKALDFIRRGDSFLPFLKNGISYGPYGTIRLLDDFLKDEDSKKRGTEDITNNLFALYRKAAFLKKAADGMGIPLRPFESVEPTNLLMEQKDYRTCLDFFLRRQDERRLMRKEFRKNLLALFHERLHAVEKDGFLVGTDGRMEYRLRTDEDMTIEIRHGDKKTLYALEVGFSFFFPALTIRNGKDERTFSFLEVNDLLSFIVSWTALTKREKDGICPICHSPAIDGHCPLCHANIQEEEDGIDFVTNVPFLKIGGQHEKNL